MYIFTHGDKYLVKLPYWNAGTWTKKRREAARYTYNEAMDIYKSYPQFTMIRLGKR